MFYTTIAWMKYSIDLPCYRILCYIEQQFYKKEKGFFISFVCFIYIRLI